MQTEFWRVENFAKMPAIKLAKSDWIWKKNTAQDYAVNFGTWAIWKKNIKERETNPVLYLKWRDKWKWKFHIKFIFMIHADWTIVSVSIINLHHSAWQTRCERQKNFFSLLSFLIWFGIHIWNWTLFEFE